MDDTESPAFTAYNWPGSAEHGKTIKPKPKTKKTRAKKGRKPRAPPKKPPKKPVYKPPWGEGDLPETAPRSKEIEWVHSNLADMIEASEGHLDRINYARCTTPPPSRGTVLLLQIAAEKPADFVKARLAGFKHVVDPLEMERRDKMQVADIEAVLEQFEEAGKR